LIAARICPAEHGEPRSKERKQDGMSSEAATAAPNGDGFLVAVHPGAGLIDRRQDWLLVVPTVNSSQWPAVGKLLDRWHRPGAQFPSQRERTLAALLEQAEAGRLPGLAVLAGLDTALEVRAYGDVEVSVGAETEQRFRGSDASRWAARRLADSLNYLRVAVPGAPDVTDPIPLLLDLQAGTVPGSGVTLRRAAAEPVAAIAPVEPVPTAAASQVDVGQPVLAPEIGTFESLLLTAATPPLRPARPALPLENVEAWQQIALGAETVLVSGLDCDSGHFNDPATTHCATCGGRLERSTRRIVRRPRPALGVLVTDGGSVFALTGCYVIGRAPERDEAVLSGRARALVLHDLGQSVSRVHAQLEVSGWRVLLTDRGSANGTLLSPGGERGPWQRIEAGRPTVFAPGATLRIGGRQLQYEAYRAELPRRREP
jgi:hypothetical protein